MGRPRIHKDDAAKAKAYRERKKAAEKESGAARVVRKVMAADAKAQ